MTRDRYTNAQRVSRKQVADHLSNGESVFSRLILAKWTVLIYRDRDRTAVLIPIHRFKKMPS